MGHADQAARAALGVVSNEKTLLCGFVLYALAAAGLFRSAWSPAARMFLAAGVFIGMLFALGTNGPAFVLLWKYLPGFDGSRTPGRLILWPTILLCLLAAGFVTRLGGGVRAPGRVIAVVLLLLVTVEGLPDVNHVTVAGEPAVMAAARGPMIVLPSDDSIDLHVMLWSTNGFPVMTNGASSIDTPGHRAIRQLMTHFPDADSVTRLRSIGVRSVVVLPDRVPGTPYADVPYRPISGLGITRMEIGAGRAVQIGLRAAIPSGPRACRCRWASSRRCRGCRR